MPNFCCVVGCGHRRQRDKDQFYRIPSERHFAHKTVINELSRKRREQWLLAIQRSDLTEENIKFKAVCSHHFVSGKPAALTDVDDIDWVPSINMGPSLKQNSEDINAFENCCVCWRNSFNASKNIVFKKFPAPQKDKILRDAWIEAIRNGLDDPNWKLPIRPRICSAHFEIGFTIPTKISKCRRKMVDFDSGMIVLHSQAEQFINTLETIGKKQNKDPEKQLLYNIRRGFVDCKVYQNTIQFDEVLMASQINSTRFRALMDTMTDYFGDDAVTANQLLLFLTKLKSGLSDALLGSLFHVPSTVVRDNFLWVTKELCSRFDNYITMKEKKSPPSFLRAEHPWTKLLVTFLEVPVPEPSAEEDREFLFSDRKLTYTTKYLIGYTPGGQIAIVSKGYGGKASELFILQDNNLPNRFNVNDTIWLSRELLDDTPRIVTPKKLSQRGRVYIKELSRKIKDFGILKNITTDLEVHLDGIVEACCIVTNFLDSSEPAFNR